MANAVTRIAIATITTPSPKYFLLNTLIFTPKKQAKNNYDEKYLINLYKGFAEPSIEIGEYCGNKQKT